MAEEDLTLIHISHVLREYTVVPTSGSFHQATRENARPKLSLSRINPWMAHVNQPRVTGEDGLARVLPKANPGFRRYYCMWCRYLDLAWATDADGHGLQGWGRGVVLHGGIFWG